VYCIKTAERIIEILSPSDRRIILVFVTKGRYVNLTASPPNGGSKYKGVAVFDQCGYISETVIDRGIVTVEDNIKSYVLHRMVPLSMTLSDPEPEFQGHSIV